MNKMDRKAKMNSRKDMKKTKTTTTGTNPM
jgi:hypothetical protein